MSRKPRSKRERRKQPAPSVGPRVDWRVPCAVAGLCVVHFVLAVTSVLHKSNTYDELAHLTRGYSYRLTDDFRLGPPHPPLAHYWASLPGAGEAIKFPRLDQPAWHESDVWTIGREFFYYKNLGNAAIIDSLLWSGRAMIALWSVALGLLVFFWSRRLFGTAGGLLSLTLFAFSPTMLAHGRLVTTDCAVALFFLCSLGTIWWMLHRISPASVALSAASLACLFLAKMSAVLIIPVGIVLLAIRLVNREPLVVSLGRLRREIRSRLGKAGCCAAVMAIWIVVVYAAIWGAYGFRYDAMRNAVAGQDRFFSPNGVPEGKTIWEHQLRGLDHLKPVIGWLREHRVFPEAYIYSAVFSSQTARGRNAFLNGQINITGFRWYFPYTFLVKTPLPLFGLLALAAGAPFVRKRTTAGQEPGEASRGHRVLRFLYRSSPLLVFFVVYWAASLRSNLNIGHRHVMPTYPVLFILCGACAAWLGASSRWVRGLVPAMCGLFILASLSIYPDYLAYFNWTIGGPDKAYYHLVDSSLDWGQDLPGLAAYLDRRKRDGQTGNVYVSYFGSGKERAVEHFGIEATMLPLRLSADATGDYAYRPGLYIISATNLQQVYNSDRSNVWTKKLEDAYQQFRPAFEKLATTANTDTARQPFTAEKFRKAFDQFQRRRFARLCAYLRTREPDHLVHHTILVFDLDAQELAAALEGPPPYPRQ